MPARLSKRTTAIIFMLINVLVWGAALPISKFAVESTSPFFFLFYRFLIAGVLTLPWLLSTWGKLPAKQKQLGRIVKLEILGTAIALGLLYAGLSRTSSLEASLLAMTVPVFVTLGGIFYLREKEDGHEWIGLLLALGGTTLLTIEPVLDRGFSQGFSSFEGNALIFLQNVAIAVYYLLAKKYYKNLPKFVVTSVSFWVGVVAFGLLAIWSSGGLNGFFLQIVQDWQNVRVIVPVVYMAIFGSIVGLTVYIKGQDLIEASEASLFTYLQPLVAAPLAFMLHREMPSLLTYVALLIIVAGVYIGEHRK